MGIFIRPKSQDSALQDQTTPIRASRFFIQEGTLTLASTATVGAKTVTFVDATGVAVGDVINFRQAGRQLQVTVLSITGAPTIAFDTPLDYAFTAAATVAYGSPQMNVNGSVTPVVFAAIPAPGAKVDITQVRIAILDNTDMDDGKFGGLTALTNGLVLRVARPTGTNVIGNIKTNGELKLFCSAEYSTKAPSGHYGITGVCHFGGQENAGVVVRLDGDGPDQLQLLVQDDLSGLVSASALVIGHVVEV